MTATPRMFTPQQMAHGLDLLAKNLGSFYLSQHELAVLNGASQYILGATDSLREHMEMVGRLKAIIRVNGLRAGATHDEIDDVINGR